MFFAFYELRVLTGGWEFAILNPDKEELSRHKITENTIFTNSYPY